jgi:hypothetical protein
VTIGLALLGLLLYSFGGIYSRAIRHWENEKIRMGFNNIPLSAVPRGSKEDEDYDVIDDRFVDHLKDIDKKTRLQLWLEDLITKTEAEDENDGDGT